MQSPWVADALCFPEPENAAAQDAGSQGQCRNTEISLKMCQFMHFWTGVRKGGCCFKRRLIGIPVCLVLIAQKCSEKKTCEWEIK